MRCYSLQCSMFTPNGHMHSTGVFIHRLSPPSFSLTLTDSLQTYDISSYGQGLMILDKLKLIINRLRLINYN